MLASLAMMSYNQTTQLISYIIMFSYFSIRNYYKISSFERYLRVILYALLATMFIYFFARASN